MATTSSTTHSGLIHTDDFSLAFNQSSIGNFIRDLLLWRDPVTSGLIFLILNVFFLMVLFEEYTFITLLSGIVLILLLNAAVYIQGTLYYARFKGQKEVRSPLLNFLKMNWRVPRSFFEENIDLFVESINFVVLNVWKALTVQDLLHSLKVILLFVSLAVLGNCFSTTALLYMGLIIDFVWIKVYSKHNKKIDAIVAKVEKKLEPALAPLKKKFPKLFESTTQPPKKLQ
eukprot:TRINITY_DN3813_c1_g1_i1.p1 TRINITY_DN3813_c1_g1~~TRINITY_DN3813_c1_g1_i1.p1  ORF type:complete len:254 (+),score=75.03 TRINITY_DN3813_c1_g1_i1:77-763(+)